MPNQFKIIQDNFFPKAFVLMGYIGLLFGILGLSENPIIGVFLFCFSGYFAFAKKVVEINVKDKKIRTFPFLFGLKFGKWKFIRNYTHVAVLSTRVVEKSFGGRTNISTLNTELFHGIYLLTPDHRNRILIKRYKNCAIAKTELEIWAKRLQLTPTRFNPHISVDTKKRK